MSVQAQFDKIIPQFDTLADLRVTTSTKTKEREVYVRGTNTIGDGGEDIWYLIGGSFTNDYDDGAWHITDMSSRLWARKSDVIKAIHFGITVYSTQPLASAGGDQSIAVQQLIDFWVDPFARNRINNKFLGFQQRPSGDRWLRPAVVGPAGYIRCDTTLTVGFIDLSGGHAARQGTSKPSSLRFEAAVMTPFTVYKPAFKLGSPSTTMDEVEMYLRCSKEISNEGGPLGDETAWNFKDYTQNRQQCKYPHIPYHKNGHFVDGTTISWGTSTLYQSELISVEATSSSHGAGLDGSRWMYVVDADGEIVAPSGTGPAGMPTHTTGTVSNLECLGMYVTPTVGSGGQHDWFDIAAADQDIGIQIVGGKDIGRRGHAVLDAEGYEYQAMVRASELPLMTGADGTAVESGVLYGCTFTMGNRKNCRVGLAIVTRENNALGYGLANGNTFLFTQDFVPFDSGNPVFDNDQTICGFLFMKDPRAENRAYVSNENVVEHIAVEVAPGRTSPAHIIQIALGHGQENIFRNIRNDGGSGTSSFISKAGTETGIVSANDIEFIRAPRFFGVIGSNNIKLPANTFGLINHWSKTVNFDKNYIQGYNSAAGLTDGKIALQDTTLIRMSTGERRMFGLASWITWDAEKDEYTVTSNNGLPGHFFRVQREPLDRNFGYIKIHPMGNGSSTARAYVIWLDNNGSIINPNRWESGLIGGSTHYACHFVNANGLNQTDVWTLDGADRTGGLGFCVPPWAHNFAVGVDVNNGRGYHISYEGTMKLEERFVQKPEELVVERPPDYGIYHANYSLPAPSGKTWLLNKTEQFLYTPTDYYATFGQHTSSQQYWTGMYVHDGLTGGNGDLWRCTVSGISNTSDPATDTGATWVLAKSGVDIVVPTDWIIV